MFVCVCVCMFVHVRVFVWLWLYVCACVFLFNGCTCVHAGTIACVDLCMVVGESVCKARVRACAHAHAHLEFGSPTGTDVAKDAQLF